MAFYVCEWLVNQNSFNLPQDNDGWAFPSAPDQHLSDTSNVEDLLIDPEDMILLPTQIQFGSEEWSFDESIADINWGEYYVRDEAFYVRDWTSGSALYSQFYVRQEPFYVQGWTSSSTLYDEFYVRQEAFYVRGWTSSGLLYAEFYVQSEPFYVHNFTPVDFFYPMQWVIC